MPRSSMPLPQLIPNRLEKLKNRLKGLLWVSLEELVLFAGKESSGDFTDISTAKGQVFKPIEPGNYFGQVSWANRWFKLTIPAAQRGQEGRRYLIWQ